MEFDLKLSNRPVWLVRSSYRILGPYLLEEVIDLLKRRQISIIDEACRPNNRWCYIRDYPEFAEVVKALRHEIDNAKDEDTMTSNTQSHQMTITAPFTESDQIKDDFTPIISPPLPMKDVSRRIEKIETEKPNEEVRSFGDIQDPRLLQKINADHRRWVIALGALCLLGFLLFGLSIMKKNRDRMASHNDSISKAIRLKNVGLYDKSINYYKKGLAIKEPSFEAQVQIAPLLIAKEGQTVVGRKILEKALLQEDLPQSLTIEYLLVIGFSYLKDGDLNKAEDFFQKALGYDPNNLNASFNLAVIKMNNRNYEGAYKDLDELMKKTKNNPLIQIMRAVLGIDLHLKNPNLERLHQIYFDLRDYAETKNFMRQKVSLLQAYVGMLLNEKLEVNRAVRNFLEQPINEDENYLQDLSMDWRSTQWENLEKYCSEIYHRHSQFPLFGAMRAVCLMSEKRELDAIKTMAEVSLLAGNEPIIKLTEAHIFFKSGKVTEAEILIRPYINSGVKLAHYLLGQICMTQQNYSCLEKNSLLLGDDSPISFYGLALAASKQGRRAEALERVRAGLALESNYLPLIDFRDQLEVVNVD